MGFRLPPLPLTLDDLDPSQFKGITIILKYFDNGVWNTTTLGRYTFHRTYFLFKGRSRNCRWRGMTEVWGQSLHQDPGVKPLVPRSLGGREATHRHRWGMHPFIVLLILPVDPPLQAYPFASLRFNESCITVLDNLLACDIIFIFIFKTFIVQRFSQFY